MKLFRQGVMMNRLINYLTISLTSILGSICNEAVFLRPHLDQLHQQRWNQLRILHKGHPKAS